VREAIRNNGLTWEKRSDDPSNDADTIEVLRRVGGFDLLGMCGMYLGGLIHGIPVIIDGFVSSIAAFAAFRLCPDCTDAMLASHVSSEPAARLILDAIGKPPLITGELHLGEGTGAVLVMPMLDMALAVYREGYTFAEGGIEPYRPL
jgi:nicotinate-nucleotide--dimethylbenzimidazole phosphoribosyltransferase